MLKLSQQYCLLKLTFELHYGLQSGNWHFILKYKTVTEILIFVSVGKVKELLFLKM